MKNRFMVLVVILSCVLLMLFSVVLQQANNEYLNYHDRKISEIK